MLVVIATEVKAADQRNEAALAAACIVMINESLVSMPVRQKGPKDKELEERDQRRQSPEDRNIDKLRPHCHIGNRRNSYPGELDMSIVVAKEV